MKITVIGTGAMGCLFGGLLTEDGADVQLLGVRKQQINTLNKQGLAIVYQGKKRIIRVRATVDPAEITGTELAVLFVKHAQTAEAARSAASLLGSTGYALTLQNGMGNAEILADILGKDRVLCGTTAQGAMVLKSGKVQHSGNGETVLGMWGQGKDAIEDPVGGAVGTEVAKIFSAAGISSKTVDDIIPVLWKKLFVNVGINAITALTGLRNGQLLAHEDARLLIRDVVAEAMAVAKAYSIELPADILEHVEQVAQATASNRSSMGQDIDNQRPTEIDAINGYIVRKAEKVGLAVPVNQTLVRLVQVVQGQYMTSERQRNCLA
ncbi:MAG: 2-dehydropantoate 2-reductase [Candidatus Electrothrix sp. AW1]|nr:2-dehydropantoate 2-reductase [Candidatus Electrothrix sp. AX1]MCI5182223.1 2-dehydropantoate 2-reductase [Candidatus Electrothrix gigas]